MPTFLEAWTADGLPRDRLLAAARDFTAEVTARSVGELLGPTAGQAVAAKGTRHVQGHAPDRTMALPCGEVTGEVADLHFVFKGYRESAQPFERVRLHRRGWPDRRHATVRMSLLRKAQGVYALGPIYAGLTVPGSSAAVLPDDTWARWVLPAPHNRPAHRFANADDASEDDWRARDGRPIPHGPACVVGHRWTSREWSGSGTDEPLAKEVAAVLVAAVRHADGGPM